MPPMCSTSALNDYFTSWTRGKPHTDIFPNYPERSRRTTITTRHSGEDSPPALCLLDAADAPHQRRRAHVCLLAKRQHVHLPERAPHDVDQPAVHLVLGPEELLRVLHPLEVRHRDAAGVGEDVGDDEDAAR